MSMEFDFVFGGRTNSPNANFYENFFRVGFLATSRNCDGEGSRYPSFWLNSGFDDYMHVSVSSGNLCQSAQKLDGYGTISIGSTYHLKIAFNNTEIVINVSGGGKDNYTQIHSRSPTLSSHIGQEANVYFMSPKFSGDYNVGNGTLSNIVIISNVFTESPTLSPVTANPTTNPTLPTLTPSFSPTLPPSTTAAPSTGPTASPSQHLESEISESKNTLPDSEIENERENGKIEREEGNAIIVIIIAVLAVSFCFICGVLILWKNQKTEMKNKERSQETDGIRDRMESQLVVSELNDVSVHDTSPKVVGVIQRMEGNDDDDDDEMGLYVNTNTPGYSYLSQAQKQELLKLTQSGNSDKNTLLASYHKFLSAAQRKEMEDGNVTKGEYDIDIDEDESSDLAVENVETAGYIGSGGAEQSEDDYEGSDADGVVLEKKMTIGADDEYLNSLKG